MVASDVESTLNYAYISTRGLFQTFSLWVTFFKVSWHPRIAGRMLVTMGWKKKLKKNKRGCLLNEIPTESVEKGM